MSELFKKTLTCSRCGLCQEACPVFKATKNETYGTRGKFMQLQGILRGDIKFSKKVKKNINLCLNCARCTKNCPSAIDTTALFSDIRAKNPSLLDSRVFFKLKMLFLKALRTFKKQKEITLPSQDALYFKGCIKSSVKVKAKSPFKCCALPFLVKGQKADYKRLREHNLKIIESTSSDIYFDCATCYDAVSNYPFCDPDTKKRLKMFVAQAPPQAKKITFHKPCHLKTDEIEKSLIALEGTEYIPLENNSCCGFGGDFFIFHPIISHHLSLQKAQSIYKTGAQTVYSACPTCIWSLKWGLFWARFTSKERPEKVKVADITALH